MSTWLREGWLGQVLELGLTRLHGFRRESTGVPTPFGGFYELHLDPVQQTNTRRYSKFKNVLHSQWVDRRSSLHQLHALALDLVDSKLHFLIQLLTAFVGSRPIHVDALRCTLMSPDLLCVVAKVRFRDLKHGMVHAREHHVKAT